MPGCNRIIPGNCCGCNTFTLDEADWLVDSGTVTYDGAVQLDGEFTPRRKSTAAAYTLTVYDFDGQFDFEIDGKTYSVEHDTDTDTITVTADGTARELIRDVVGDTDLSAVFQIRITPTHAYILAAETTEPPEITDHSIYVTGTLYTIVTVDLSADPTGNWTLTADGSYAAFYVSSSITEFADDAIEGDPPRRNCFNPPTLEASYQGYRCLLGDIANETNYPGYLFPDAGFSGDYPQIGAHLTNEFFGFAPPNENHPTQLYTDLGLLTGRGEFGTVIVNGPLNEQDLSAILGVPYFPGFPSTLNSFSAYGKRKVNTKSYGLDGGGNPILISDTNRRLYVGASASGIIAITFPAPTPDEPYPTPVYTVTLGFSAEFYQPGQFEPVNWAWSYRSPQFAPSQTSSQEIPVNDLGTISTDVSFTSTDWLSVQHPTKTPADFTDDDFGQFDSPMTAYITLAAP